MKQVENCHWDRMKNAGYRCGENFEDRKASRSMTRFEYPGMELRTLLAKDMPLDV